MDRKLKQREVFLELINKQLEPFGKSYEDVKDNPDWYMQYRTDEESEKEFIRWGIELIRKKLKLNKDRATKEMSWFILQWGLTTAVSEKMEQQTILARKNKAGQ